MIGHNGMLFGTQWDTVVWNACFFQQVLQTETVPTLFDYNSKLWNPLTEQTPKPPSHYNLTLSTPGTTTL